MLFHPRPTGSGGHLRFGMSAKKRHFKGFPRWLCNREPVVAERKHCRALGAGTNERTGEGTVIGQDSARG